MKKSAKNVAIFLVLVGFVAAHSGCVPKDCKDCSWWSFKDGREYAKKKGWKWDYEERYESNRQALYTEHEAKKTIKNTKPNIRIAVDQPMPLPKEFSVQVLRAEGVNLPELTPEKMEAVKTSIVKVLTKRGFQVNDTSSLSLIITVNQYMEGAPALVRELGSGATYGIKKYNPTVMGGNLLLTKGETEVILNMDIPTETTGASFWDFKLSTGWTLDAIREVFSLMIFYILNDYWEGKLAETDS